MRAVDTSVVIRFLIDDEPSQAAKAKAAVAAGNVFVSTTVMLESDWVLRHVYGLSGAEAVATLRAFAGLPGIRPESPDLILDALDHAENGIDCADALHLATARCETLPTLDRRFTGLAGVRP